MLLGTWKGRTYGVKDDRHVVMIAGSRAGKTATVLLPNIRAYPGPCIVIDPKGELAAATAIERRRFGPVHVLDPFGASGLASSSHNPLEELRRSRPEDVVANAAQLADALIVPASSGDSHWTDSAKNLLTGLILYLLRKNARPATMGEVRALLNERPIYFAKALMDMAEHQAFDGALANIGRAFLSMVLFKDGMPIGYTQEMGSILSTARQQTAPLDQVVKVMGASSFSLADIGRSNLTIYLVLPASRLGTHYRWLRLFIMQAFAAMEMNPIPRNALPAWFILEEFAALGHVQAIETAAGYMAGFGAKLFVVLQDLTQLRRHYKESWETFLGNAGVLMAFGLIDATTTKYISELIGQTNVEEVQRQYTSTAQRDSGDDGLRTNQRPSPLLAPFEIALHFSRRTNRALVLVPGWPATYLNRLPLS